MQQHEADGNEVGAPCYGPCLIRGQPEGVGHEHEAEEDEEENGHGVAHPLLFIAEHEGEGVYDEDGEERELDPPLNGLPCELHYALALGVLSSEGEGYGCSHGEEEEGEDYVDPCYAVDCRVKHMVWWRHLCMIHPPWQDRERLHGRENHRNDGVAAQGIESMCAGFLVVVSHFLWFLFITFQKVNGSYLTRKASV